VNPSYAYGTIERMTLHEGLDVWECCRRWRENAAALERGEALPHALSLDQRLAGRAEYRKQSAGPWEKQLRALITQDDLRAAERSLRILLPDVELETANAPEPTLDEIRMYHARIALTHGG